MRVRVVQADALPNLAEVQDGIALTHIGKLSHFIDPGDGLLLWIWRRSHVLRTSNSCAKDRTSERFVRRCPSRSPVRTIETICTLRESHVV